MQQIVQALKVGQMMSQQLLLEEKTAIDLIANNVIN